MAVLEMAVCFISARFGVSLGIFINGLHADKRIVGLLMVKGGGRASNGSILCVEGDRFLFECMFVVVNFVPSFEFSLKIIYSVEEFGNL